MIYRFGRQPLQPPKEILPHFLVCDLCPLINHPVVKDCINFLGQLRKVTLLPAAYQYGSS